MIGKRNGRPAKPIWAYAYELDSPQPEERLQAIRTLLDQEHAVARKKARTWRGKFVLKEEATHILVVSDTAKQNRDINRRLEAMLKELKVGFSLTSPLAVEEHEAPQPVRRPRKAAL